MDGNKFNIYDNSKEALAHIMQVHGSDVLLGSMLKSYFNDYAPRVETLRKNVIFSVSMSGAGDILKRNIQADDVGHENAFRQAVQRVVDTYGTERGLVESVVREFTDALGWRISVQTPVAEMQHVQMQQGQQMQTHQTHQTQMHPQNVSQHTQISNLQIGQRNVKFGRYNWRVLDIQNGKALLLAEDVVELRPYHVTYEDVTWEKCTLRGYLNGEFLEAFSDAERSRIMESTVMNVNNSWFGTEGGSVTRDSVFLLSLEEVVRYFGDSGALARKMGKGIRYLRWNGGELVACEPSNAQRFMDQYSNERRKIYNEGMSWWWLRSPGYNSHCAAAVGNDGAVCPFSVWVTRAYGGVCPALWINLTECNAGELINEESQHVQPQQVRLRSCNTHKKKYLPRGHVFKWPWQ